VSPADAVRVKAKRWRVAAVVTGAVYLPLELVGFPLAFIARDAFLITVIVAVGLFQWAQGWDDAKEDD
jgi:hypothetical protein